MANPLRKKTWATRDGTLTIEQVGYDAFGSPDDADDYDIYGMPEPTAGLTASVRARHLGRQFDYTTGLTLVGGQNYTPSGGRFLSENRALAAGGETNLYRFAGNSPANTDAAFASIDPGRGSTSGWDNFTDAYSYYVTPWHNDPGLEGYLFGYYKFMGWTAFTVGTLGAGILSGGALLGGTGLAYATSTTTAVAGATAGAMQVHAADPSAGFASYAFGIGLGGGFGGAMPVAGLWDLTGTLAGGGIEKAFGGDFFGQGMQWGGLVGGIAGGGLSHGWKMAAWQTSFAAGGAGIGYGVYGTPEGALLGANFGMMGGGIAGSAYGRYAGARAPTTSPVRQRVLANIADNRKAVAATEQGYLRFDRQVTARQFYGGAGFGEGRIQSHLQGIDFSKPVTLQTIPEGAYVEQWVKGGRVGNYFGPLGQAPEMSGISRGMRTPIGFRANQDVSVLRSHASPITDTWTLGPDYPINTPGGGIQYFTPNRNAFDAVFGW